MRLVPRRRPLSSLLALAAAAGLLALVLVDGSGEMMAALPAALLALAVACKRYPARSCCCGWPGWRAARGALVVRLLPTFPTLPGSAG